MGCITFFKIKNIILFYTKTIESVVGSSSKLLATIIQYNHITIGRSSNVQTLFKQHSKRSKQTL
jgi:precorrin-6B methylase 2